MKILLCLLLSVFSVNASQPLCCLRNKLKRPVPISTNRIVKFINSVALSNFEPPQRDRGAENCPWLAEVHRWIEWRQRNPHAASRFPNAPKSLDAILNFGPTFEPEPDPSVLGCGCEFYDSCGFWHTVFG